MTANDRVTVTLIDRTRRERDWGVDRAALAAALQAYVDRCLAPTWGVAARLRFATDFEPGAWALVFVDESPQHQASLGYHQLSVGGFPMGVVPVGAVRRAGKPVSALAAHELAEMLVNPAGNLLVQRPNGGFFALEICDPVRDVTFPIDGVPVTDFVLPGWFLMVGPWRYQAPDGRLDYLGHIRQPFQIHRGGYVATVVGGRWRRQAAEG